MRPLVLLLALLAAGCGDAPAGRTVQPPSADTFFPIAWGVADGSGGAR